MLDFQELYKADHHRYNKEISYRKCGHSGIRLPQISLGFWHNFGYSDSFQEAVDMVKYAFDNGITHFDLANNYGPPFGAAEENFGRIFHQNLRPYRDEMIITSKAGHLMWEGPYGDGGSRKYLISSLDQSLKRMQLDYVDVFYSHRYDPNTPIEETLQALVDIVKQGKAIYIGLSKYPIDKLLYAFDFLKAAGTPCLMYQDKYNLLNREMEAAHLEAAATHGAGFVAFSPLAQGMLSDKYLHGIPKDSRAARPDGYLKPEQVTGDIVSKVGQLQAIALRRGQTLVEMSLAWLLKDEKVSSVIVGSRTVKQLQDSINTVRNITFTTEEIEAIDHIVNP